MREEVGSWVKTRRGRDSRDSGDSYKGASHRGNNDIGRIGKVGRFINRSVVGGMLVHRSGYQS